MNPDQNKAQKINPVPAPAGRPEPYLTLGVAIGLGAGIGLVIGILTNTLAISMGVGAGVGVAIGAALESSQTRRTRPPGDTPRK